MSTQTRTHLMTEWVRPTEWIRQVAATFNIPEDSLLQLWPPPQPRFIDNGDGTITDTLQGLMWTKATISDERVNLATAERLCADCRIGGYTDWVVPDFDPLHSLVDRTRCEPAIDVAIFPDTRYMTYWSRTPAAWSPRAAWVVGFTYGYSSGYLRGNAYAFVRACRALTSAD